MMLSMTSAGLKRGKIKTSVIKGIAKKLKSQHSLNKLRQISNLLVEAYPFSLTLKYISQLFNFFLD